MKETLLDIKNIHVQYGTIKVLRDISLNVFPGELVSLIGANGAGKTTLLKSIVGLTPIHHGNITLSDQEITNNPTHTLVAHGLTMVPEGRGIFAHMSVLENLLMGAYHRNDSANIKQDLEHNFSLFPRLADRRHQICGTMSGGEQQMVAIARALMSKPSLLLLDEPSMGLAPLLVKKIFDILKKINQEGVSILLVEQNANAALSLAHRAYVMEHGEITMSGNAHQLMCNPEVITAYLGG
jgi:branched-chain amino acid transport system ATP-binding protein